MNEAETPFPKSLITLTHVFYTKDTLTNSDKAHSMIWTNGK